MHILLVWALLGGGVNSLEKGAAALTSYRAEEALEHLERAKSEGPYHHAEHLRLYELLGIAYCYLDRGDEALEAFDYLLALDPGYAVSYTLSPKVTFLFQEARKKARARRAPMVQLGWPRELMVTDPIPIDVEVVADPRGFLKRAKLHTRLKGKAGYQAQEIELPAAGDYRKLDLAPAAPQAEQPQILQLYLTAHDGHGNQVLLLGKPDQPREIPLGYQPPTPWYGKWWVWAIAGGLIAAGTGTAVYLLTQDAPDSMGGTFHTNR